MSDNSNSGGSSSGKMSALGRAAIAVTTSVAAAHGGNITGTLQNSYGQYATRAGIERGRSEAAAGASRNIANSHTSYYKGD